METAFKVINKIQEYVVIFLVSVCILVGTLQVASRFIFSISIPWSEELIRYSFVWIVFIGASLAVRDNQHATITVVADLLPAKAREIISIIVDLLCIAFAYFMITEGFNLVKMQIATNQLTSATELPIAIVTVIIPVGAILMVLNYIKKIFLSIKKIGQKQDGPTVIDGEG